LYLPTRETFPSQLNGDYTFMLQGDSEELLKFGYWNQSLAMNWITEADYILFQVRNYPDAVGMGFQEEQFDEIVRSPQTNPCYADSSIMIFKSE
jgi:hypothetical protein